MLGVLLEMHGIADEVGYLDGGDLFGGLVGRVVFGVCIRVKAALLVWWVRL